MTSQLENRIMKRVRAIALYRKIRAQIPVKAVLLACVLSLSARMISYDVILGYISGRGLRYQAWYLAHAALGTSLLKLAVLIVMAVLVVSILKDLVRILLKQELSFRTE